MKAAAVLLEGLGAEVLRALANGEPAKAVDALLNRSTSQLEAVFVTAAVMEGLKPAWARAITTELGRLINE